jgi:hypothetical protein
LRPTRRFAAQRAFVVGSILTLIAAGCFNAAPTAAPPTAGPLATASSAPTPSIAPAPTPAPPSPSPTAVTATPTAIAGTTTCNPSQLTAKVLKWEGVSGHRAATVRLTNAGTSACTVADVDRPQLVGGNGAILINGTAPAATTSLTVAAGAALTTSVLTGNYCGSTPVPPVTVAFVLPASIGRVVASPVSATDTDGVPPCLGPGGPASIQMQPWAP